MTGPNHIVGGYAFTGLFASIMGVNFLSDWKYIAVIFFGSLLPDIDHTKSMIGKVFYPISKPLNRRYGHRTITHSLIFLIGTTALLAAFQAAYFPTFQVTLLFFLSVSSHLIFDMMTVQGVPLFYPFLKNPCVLPGDPKMRLRTSNLRHETIAMSVFIVSSISLQPLFKNGFWTNYNRLFGTMKHLSSEYNKSRDMLEVSFALIEGSEIDTLSGLVVRASERDMTIIKDGDFRTYPMKGQLVRDIYPIHTGKKYRFENRAFQEINTEDINSILATNEVTKLDISGSEKFIIHENGFGSDTKSWRGTYLNSVYIEEIPSDETVDFIENKTIEKLKEQRQMFMNKERKSADEYNVMMKDYNMIIQSIENASDLVEKELLQTKYSSLKKPKKPSSLSEKISELDAKINELQHQDRLRHQKLIFESKDIPLKVSGTYEILVIDDADSH